MIETDTFSWQIASGGSGKRFAFGGTVMVAGSHLTVGRSVIVCGLIRP